MDNYECYLSKEALAKYSGVTTVAVEACGEAGLLPEVEGSTLFHPNAIEVMRFVQRALAAGFEVKEIRSMLHLIEICGGDNEFVVTVVQEKRERLRLRAARLSARDRIIDRFMRLCRHNGSRHSGDTACVIDAAAAERRGAIRERCIELLAQERALARFESTLHDGSLGSSLLATRPQSSAGAPAM